MFETMYEAPGIGLAAIQVGVPQRVVTIDLAKKDEPKQPQVFINPEIVWSLGGEGHLRGGLPLDPGILRGGRAAGAGEGPIHRPRRQGARDRGERPARDLLQHEIDHLNGVLFIDHISKLKRDRVDQEIHQGGEAELRQEFDRPRTATSSLARSSRRPTGHSEAQMRGPPAPVNGCDSATGPCDPWFDVAAISCVPRNGFDGRTACPSPRLHGHARFRGADPGRDRRARP